VPALWTRARGAQQSEERWVRGIGVRSDWGRSAVIEVSERRPLLQLIGAGFPYWLCDDGMLIPKQQQNDRGEIFSAIARLPRVSLPDDPGEGLIKEADTYLRLVAACDRYLPGQITRIELNRNGEVNLYQPSGFEIRLGSEDLSERIAALPQVLRVCEDHKDRLRYIYATEVNGTLVFYEKWKGPAKPHG
jgi:hypothetical protein